MENEEKVIFNRCYKILSEICTDAQTNDIYYNYLINLDTVKQKYLLAMFNTNHEDFYILILLMAMYQALLQNKISWKISEIVMSKMLKSCSNLYHQENRLLNQEFYFDILEQNNCIVIAPILDDQFIC